MANPAANTSNYAAIITAIQAVALTTPFVQAPAAAATKIGLLPFPDEINQPTTGLPFLAVRFGKFLGFADPRTLQPTGGDRWARVQGGIGRIFGWDFDVVMLYGYRPDSSSATTAAHAADDMVALEQTFQQNPQLNNTCDKASPHALRQGPISPAGMNLAGRQLFYCALTVRVLEKQGVTYSS